MIRILSQKMRFLHFIFFVIYLHCFRNSTLLVTVPYLHNYMLYNCMLRDTQKIMLSMISRRNSRAFCELCSQKQPREILSPNSYLFFCYNFTTDIIILYQIYVYKRKLEQPGFFQKP